MAIKIGIMLVVLAVLACTPLPRGGNVSGSQARRLVEEGALLLDVRTPEEYSADHLPSARNVPVQELGQRLSEIGPKDKPIVVYCRSGHRSAQAAKLLKGAGYTEVHDLGAKARW